jgi:hypothetical protein
MYFAGPTQNVEEGSTLFAALQKPSRFSTAIYVDGPRRETGGVLDLILQRRATIDRKSSN